MAGGCRGIVAREHGGEVQRLVRECRCTGRPARPRRAWRPAAECVAVPSGPSGRNTSPASNSARSRKPREWLRLAISIRPGSTEVRRQPCSSLIGLASLTALRAAPAVGHAEGVVGGLGDERVRQHLGQTGVGEGLQHAAALLLDAGQAASRGRHRQGRGDLVVADQAGDFLGEVLRRLQVVAPARRGDRVAGRRSSPRRRRGPSSEVSDLLVGEVDADPGGGEALPAVSMTTASGAVPTSVPAVSAVPPASSTSRSTTRWAATSATCQSTPRSKRLDASDGSLWRRRGAGDRDLVEVRGLDQHVDGGVRRPRWRRRP